MTDPNPPALTGPAVKADARDRAFRTFLQGIGVDVAVAIAAFILTNLDGVDLTDKAGLIAIAVSLAKTVLTTVAAYVMRLKLKPANVPDAGNATVATVGRVALVMLLALVLTAVLAVVRPPAAHAGERTVTLSGACTVSGVQMFVKQTVTVYSPPNGNVVHYGLMQIFGVPTGAERRASLRYGNEVVFRGPVSFLGASPISYDWNYGFSPNTTTNYLRVYLYIGAGCHVTLTAPTS